MSNQARIVSLAGLLLLGPAGGTRPGFAATAANEVYAP
jgi:hypothetical protein